MRGLLKSFKYCMPSERQVPSISLALFQLFISSHNMRVLIADIT